MTTARRLLLVVSLLCPFAIRPAIAGPDVGSALEPDLKGDVKSAIDRGLTFLRWNQKDDGSWEDDAGTTALGLYAFVNSHRRYVEEDGPFIRRPVRYLTPQLDPGHSRPFDGDPQATAVTLLSLATADPRRYADSVGAARVALLAALSGERPDLRPAAICFVAAALNAASVLSGDSVWERVSNLAGGGGGAGRLCVLLAAGKERTDPLVQAARAEAGGEYQALLGKAPDRPDFYWSSLALAYALHGYGDPHLVDAAGGRHDWRAAIARPLLAAQQSDGSWVEGVGERSTRALPTSLALHVLELLHNQPLP